MTKPIALISLVFVSVMIVLSAIVGFIGAVIDMIGDIISGDWK